MSGWLVLHRSHHPVITVSTQKKIETEAKNTTGHNHVLTLHSVKISFSAGRETQLISSQALRRQHFLTPCGTSLFHKKTLDCLCSVLVFVNLNKCKCLSNPFVRVSADCLQFFFVFLVSGSSIVLCVRSATERRTDLIALPFTFAFAVLFLPLPMFYWGRSSLGGFFTLFTTSSRCPMAALYPPLVSST